MIPKDEKKSFIIVPGNNGKGEHIFSVLVKRSYQIKPEEQVVPIAPGAPLLKGDVYYDNGDPRWSTVLYESDTSPFKPATDVVLIGKAHSPEKKSVASLGVSLEISNVKKSIIVTGDRQCIFQEKKPPLFTDPKEFTTMDIRYENAYGGWDRNSFPDMPVAYPRNTMGKGFAIKNIPEIIEGLPLPNLEDPEDLLSPERIVLGDPSQWSRQPLPQGFGWFQRTWYPRCSFVGSVPGFINAGEVTKEELLGMVPKNHVSLARQLKLPTFDVKFNNGASHGLILPYLNGDEKIKLTNLTPHGELTFYLPDDQPKIRLDIGLGKNELKGRLHTVCIRSEEMLVDTLWRGAHVYPGIEWLPKMKKMIAEVC